ncbi:MAG: O-acetyl-ADP-ribose deacetylase [Chloroflexi bacterium]|nr:O-acetyl-ADP-ribose deacetylase [Chloroflexota bacterium]
MASIELWQGDITTLAVDAIVNAANNGLRGGGGVDGAIHRAAGPELDSACRKIGWCATGQAVITPGFRLPAKYIIHTVGPVWGAQDEATSDTLLASCYHASLALAAAHGLGSIAFPAISTGVYGYPMRRAAFVALNAVRAALAEVPSIERVILVSYQPEMQRIYGEVMRGLDLGERYATGGRS